MGFSLGQSVYGIGREPAGVADLGVDRGAGGAKANGQVARSIHRRTAHPAPGRIRLVGALLKDRWRGRHAAQLEPADTCHAARAHGIVAHGRFVAVGELAIGQPEHQTVANSVQLVGSRAAQLGDTGSGAGTESGEARGGGTADESKGGVSGRSEIGVEKPDLVDAGARERDKRIGGAGSGKDRTVEVARQEGRFGSSSGYSRGDKSSRQTGEHFRAVKGEGLGPEKGGARGVEHVHGHVVAVGPDAEMRIIEKVGAQVKGITIVSAGGIRGSRDGDALVGRNRCAGELADEPAVGDMVVEDDGVAVAIALADAAEAGPDRGDGSWPQDRCTGCFVKDLITFVHHLDVLREPHGAVGVGRCAIASDTWKWDAVKIKGGRGYVRDQGLQQGVAFDDRIRNVHVQGERQLGIQIGLARFFLGIRFRRGPHRRKIAQRRRDIVVIRLTKLNAGIFLRRLCQSGRAWVNSKGKQRQEGAGQAKSEAEEEAQIDKGEW